MFRDECMHTVAYTAMTAHLPPSPSAEPGTILSADMELHMYMQCTFWNRPITGTHVHEQSYYITHYMYIKKGGRERKKKQTLTSLEVHQCIAQVHTHVRPTCQSSYTENKQVHVQYTSKKTSHKRPVQRTARSRSVPVQCPFDIRSVSVRRPFDSRSFLITV